MNLCLVYVQGVDLINDQTKRLVSLGIWINLLPVCVIYSCITLLCRLCFAYTDHLLHMTFQCFVCLYGFTICFSIYGIISQLYIDILEDQRCCILWVFDTRTSFSDIIITVVRTVYGYSKGFEVKVGMHRGLALSPLLFVIDWGGGIFRGSISQHIINYGTCSVSREDFRWTD